MRKSKARDSSYRNLLEFIKTNTHSQELRNQMVIILEATIENALREGERRMMRRMIDHFNELINDM
jgi:hypothetical protein